jgi:hypothetical protein
MILAVCAHENLVLQQFDVRTAFLNGEIKEEVYVRPLPGRSRAPTSGCCSNVGHCMG